MSWLIRRVNAEATIRANLGGEPNDLAPKLAGTFLEFSAVSHLSQCCLGSTKT